jgi:transposase
MAMGKKKRKQQQQSMWMLTSELPTSPAHPFYARLNTILEEARFDEFVESRCRRFYSEIGRPGLSPGRYFRLFLLGYFEGMDSERGMAWRVADSPGVRSFLGLDLNEQGPDHSTISRTRRLTDVETHREVFTWVLERLAESDLLSGKTLAVDGTTLEANAAMRSIVRRDTGQSYPEYLADLALASGVKTPSRAALARLDCKRKTKGSNDEWTSPADPDAKIAKMKDGRTHLAHKAGHAVDLETSAVVAVTIQDADAGDTSTLKKTLAEAEARLDLLMRKPEFFDMINGIQEAVPSACLGAARRQRQNRWIGTAARDRMPLSQRAEFGTEGMGVQWRHNTKPVPRPRQCRSGAEGISLLRRAAGSPSPAVRCPGRGEAALSARCAASRMRHRHA